MVMIFVITDRGILFLYVGAIVTFHTEYGPVAARTNPIRD